MPLSEPVAREARHQRAVTCCGYRREDGLWDIEGELRDTKSYPFPNHRGGHVATGEPIHAMAMRLTVDIDLTVRAIEVVSDAVPNPLCRAVLDNFQALVGLTIGPGFLREVRARLGGRQGCTHLVELVGPIATAAFQTLYDTREARDEGDPDRERPYIIDTCHTLRSDGPVVRKRWPQFYTGPDEV